MSDLPKVESNDRPRPNLNFNVEIAFPVIVPTAKIKGSLSSCG